MKENKDTDKHCPLGSRQGWYPQVGRSRSSGAYLGPDDPVKHSIDFFRSELMGLPVQKDVSHHLDSKTSQVLQRVNKPQLYLKNEDFVFKKQAHTFCILMTSTFVPGSSEVHLLRRAE